MASKTRYHELTYHQAFRGLWRIIGPQGAEIGPHYASKAELLADLDRFAAEYGCDGAFDEASALRARVAKLEAALESVCVALLPHDSRCQNVNAVFEAHDRARAALKGA